MNGKKRALRSLRLAFVTALLAGAAASGPPASAQTRGGVIVVRLEGIRSDRGQIGCSLWSGERGFPGEVEHSERSFWTANKGAASTCVFAGVSPGEYAISVVHDENGNDALDRNLFGAPTEGWGVSNDAEPHFMSGPSYEDARFHFDGGRRRMTIRMRY